MEKINPYNAGNQPAAISQCGAGPPTTAEFMLELDDVVALSLHAPATRRRRRVGLICVCVLCVLCIVSVVGVGLGKERSLGFGTRFLLGLTLALSMFLSPPLWRRRTRREYGRIYGGTLPWHEAVILSSEGIKRVSPHSEGLHRWRAIQNISATPTHVFFYVNNAQAVVVPARAFFDEAEFHAFVALASDFWTKATGRSAEEGITL